MKGVCSGGLLEFSLTVIRRFATRVFAKRRAEHQFNSWVSVGKSSASTTNDLICFRWIPSTVKYPYAEVTPDLSPGERWQLDMGSKESLVKIRILSDPEGCEAPVKIFMASRVSGHATNSTRQVYATSQVLDT